jgi:hypothetical protein
LICASTMPCFAADLGASGVYAMVGAILSFE